MTKLYIEFTRPKGKIFPFFSWLIRLVERSRFSHVRLTWVNSTKTKVVYEASGSQVSFFGPKAQEKRPVVIEKMYEVDISKEEYRALVKICMEYAGVKYGAMQILGIVLSYLFFLKKNPLTPKGDYSQVCSEIVARFLEDVKNVDIKGDLNIIGPKGLEGQLKEIAEERIDINKII
jgi:hypothetical protein